MPEFLELREVILCLAPYLDFLEIDPTEARNVNRDVETLTVIPVIEGRASS
jgi:hypothetical protein